MSKKRKLQAQLQEIKNEINKMKEEQKKQEMEKNQMQQEMEKKQQEMEKKQQQLKQQHAMTVNSDPMSDPQLMQQLLLRNAAGKRIYGDLRDVRFDVNRMGKRVAAKRVYIKAVLLKLGYDGAIPAKSSNTSDVVLNVPSLSPSGSFVALFIISILGSSGIIGFLWTSFQGPVVASGVPFAFLLGRVDLFLGSVSVSYFASVWVSGVGFL
eukprot:g70596.t1